MRFWPFGKRQRAETSKAPPTAVSAPVGTAEPARRPPTGAWRRLPPLRATATSLELTAPVQRLADTMTSTQRPQVSAPELGHRRSLGGPTGTVAGLVRQHRVVQSDSAGVPLTFAHAPEPVEAAHAVPIRPWGSAQRLPASAPSTPAPAEANAPTVSPVAASTGDQPSPLPKLTARAMPSRTVPTATPIESAPVAVPAAAAPVVQRVSAPAVVEPDGAPSAEPAATVERSLVEAPRPSRPDAPTLGSTRIVRRIGAPLHARPSSMVDAVPAGAAGDAPQNVQRLTVASGAPSAEPSAEPPSPSGVASSVPGGLPSMPARSMPARSMPAPSIVAARRSSGGAEPPASARSVPAAGDAPIVGNAPSIQRLSGDAPSMTIPKLTSPEQSSATPTATPTDRPTVVPVRRGVQRVPESVPPTVRSELEPLFGESLDDVEVHRGPETGAAARSIQAKAFTTGGAVYMPDEVGSTASGEGRKILAHELTHVVQQRSLGGSLPSEDSAEGARLESEARIVGGQDPVPTRPVQPAARPAATGPAQRLAGSPMPDMARPLTPSPGAMPAMSQGSAMPLGSQSAIVATVQAAASRAGVPSSPPPSPTVVPSASVSTAAAPTPVVQRLAGDGAQVATEASHPAGRPGGPTTSNVSAPDGARPGSETDIDDLARQLYPKFRTRLRSDLLADRERSGRLFDR